MHTVGLAMRRAHRPLHVLACAPVVAAAAITLAPWSHAVVRAAPATPIPVVVVLDPGHGGSYDPSNPAATYDPGGVSAGGAREADISLDVARQVAALLAADDVAAVLTRNRDVYMDIAARTQVAKDHHCDAFTSIHMNSFADPAAKGSVVLYPFAVDHAFATGMAASLDAALSPLGLTSRGTMLRDDWWLSVPCPVTTVEPLFLSNPTEAQLIARDDVRHTLARAIRDGIEAQLPAIAARKPALEAYRAAHGGSLPAGPVKTNSGVSVAPVGGGPVNSHADPPAAAARATPRAAAPPAAAGVLRRSFDVAWQLVAVALLLAAPWRLRRQVLHGGALLSAGILEIVARIEGRQAPLLVERFSRCRRRASRRRAVLERGRVRAHARAVRGGAGYGALAYPRSAAVIAAASPTAATTPRSTGSGRRRARPAPR